MDREHTFERFFAETMIDNFHGFVSKLVQEPDCFVPSQWFKKLEAIKNTLSTVLEKHDRQEKETPAISPRTEVEVEENICAIDTSKRKSSSSSLEELEMRVNKSIRSDIEGSDSSDSDECEIKSKRVVSDGFQPSDKVLSHEDVRSGTLPVVELDQFIRPITSKSTTSIMGSEDLIEQCIEMVSEDVFWCSKCKSRMHKNDLSPHIQGRSHKKALSKREADQLQPEVQIINVIEYIPGSNLFRCKDCKISITCAENARQHVNGKQHQRKLQEKNKLKSISNN